MKRLFLASSVALPFLIAAGLNCSADDSVVLHPTTAGTTSAGTAGSATTTTTTGNATSTTGSGGAATTVGAGGTTGSTTVGTGGTGGAGVTGAGGAAGGAGGASGGAAGGTGVGGAGGAGAICTAGDCTAVLKTAGGKAMDGWANIDPPASTTPPDGHQGPSMIDNVASNAMTAGIPCVSTETAGGRPLKVAHWQLAGPGINAGTTYAVTIHFWGVLECKTYLAASLTNCTREVDPGRGLTVAHDMWCPGATDPALANGTDHYNTYMISVTPTSSATTPNLGGPGGVAPTAGNWWMMNECPVGNVETHKTWRIDYEKTIPVPAGSWINFTDYDTNCLEIINCGDSADAAGVCNTHYTFAGFPNAIPPPDPALNLTGTTAAAAGGNSFGQWIYFDVRNVTPM